MPKKATTTDAYPILERLFRRASWELTPEAAHSLCQLAFDDADRARMHELARKVSAGHMNWDEQREADFYEFLGVFLDLLHAKARISIKRTKKGA